MKFFGHKVLILLCTSILLMAMHQNGWAKTTNEITDTLPILYPSEPDQSDTNKIAALQLTETDATDTIPAHESVYLVLPAGITFKTQTPSIEDVESPLAPYAVPPYENGIHSNNAPLYLPVDGQLKLDIAATGALSLSFDGTQAVATDIQAWSVAALLADDSKSTTAEDGPTTVFISYAGKEVMAFTLEDGMPDTAQSAVITFKGANLPLLKSSSVKYYTTEAEDNSATYPIPGTLADNGNRVVWKSAEEGVLNNQIDIFNMFVNIPADTLDNLSSIDDLKVLARSAQDGKVSRFHDFLFMVSTRPSSGIEMYASERTLIKPSLTDVDSVSVGDIILQEVSPGAIQTTDYALLGPTKITLTLPAGFTFGTDIEVFKNAECNIAYNADGNETDASGAKLTLDTTGKTQATLFILASSTTKPAILTFTNIRYAYSPTSELDVPVQIAGNAIVEGSVINAVVENSFYALGTSMESEPTCSKEATYAYMSGLVITESFANAIDTTKAIQVILPAGIEFAEDISGTLANAPGGMTDVVITPGDITGLSEFTVKLNANSVDNPASIQLSGTSLAGAVKITMGPEVLEGPLDATVIVPLTNNTNVTQTFTLAKIGLPDVTVTRYLESSSLPTFGIGHINTDTGDKLKIKLTENISAALSIGKTISMTLSGGATFVDGANTLPEPKYDLSQDTNIQLNSVPTLSQDKTKVSFTIYEQNNTTEADSIVLSLNRINLPMTMEPSELFITFDGTAGVKEALTIGRANYTTTAQILGDPASIKQGRTAQRLQDIQITENFTDALNHYAAGNTGRFKLIAPPGLRWLPTTAYDIVVTSLIENTTQDVMLTPCVELDTTQTIDDTLIFNLDILPPDHLPSAPLTAIGPRTITIRNLEFDVPPTLPDGPITLFLTEDRDEPSRIRPAYITAGYIGEIPTMTIQPESLTLTAGTKAEFTVTSTDPNDVSLTIISARDDIATVSQKTDLTATILGVAEGTTGISVKCNYSQIEMTIPITVLPAESFKLGDSENTSTRNKTGTLSKSTIDLVTGEEDFVTVSGGYPPYIAFANDDSIVDVSVDYDTITVKSLAAGTTTVTLRDSSETPTELSVKVTVTDREPFTVVDPENNTLQMFLEETGTITLSGGLPPYQATVNDAKLATVELNADTLVVAAGDAQESFTITLTDSSDKPGSQQVVTVNITYPIADPPTECPRFFDHFINPRDPNAEFKKSQAKVYLGTGSSQTSGSVVNLTANFPPYSRGVDIIIAVMMPPTHEMVLVNSSNELVPFTEGLTLFRSNQTEAVSETIFKDMAVKSEIPAYDYSGIWYVAYMVYETGQTDMNAYDLLIYTFEGTAE